MAKNIIFAMRKGGCGKSTLAFTCAKYIEAIGKKVLVADLDPQANLSEALIGNRELDITCDAGMLFEDVFSGELVKISEHIDLIPNMTDSAGVLCDDSLPVEATINVGIHLDNLAIDHDYVVIDTPNMGRGPLLAIIAAGGHIVAPVEPTGFGLQGLSQLAALVEEFRIDGGADIQIGTVLINKYQSGAKVHKMYESMLREVLGEQVLELVVNNRMPVQSAMANSQPVWDHKGGHGRETGKHVKKVMQDILDRVG